MPTAIAQATTSYDVILEPDCDAPEWWAGAPSICLAPDGATHLAARMREGNSPRGRRGYEVRLLKSRDGRHFDVVNRISRAEAKVPGFERPSLVRDPQTGLYRLYGCAGLERGWAILRWDDAADPADIDPRSARPVLRADYPDDGFAHVMGYKDPHVFWDGAEWRMFVIGYDRVERIWQFLSDDGETWRPASGEPVMENNGWHNFYTRPACVLPLSIGYLFVYEGSHVNWRDPVYNIATGLAYTPDLETFHDLTPDEPLLKSTTPGDYHTWRYSHWLRVGDEVRVYYEAARPNNSNEIRLSVMAANDALP